MDEQIEFDYLPIERRRVILEEVIMRHRGSLYEASVMARAYRAAGVNAAEVKALTDQVVAWQKKIDALSQVLAELK